MFDWNDLKYFLAFARNGSMLAAAKTLGVNQSTLRSWSRVSVIR